MRLIRKTLLASAALALMVGVSLADCGIDKGSIRILSNDFPALRAVVDEATKCANDAVKLTKNQTKDHETLAVPALKANPAEYTSAIVANSSILPLLSDGLIRPLDDLVAKSGSAIQKSQLITIDGKVMAVAVMANAQHLFYRDDILKAAGVAPPKTYEELLTAAKTIKEKGLMEYPVGGTYKAGWNLAEEFVNMYLGEGGNFFKADSAEAAINNAKGVAALNMMKSLSEYMNKDYLTFDSNSLQAEFKAGKVALANFWGSRAGAVLNPEGSKPEITSNIKFAAAPTVAGGSVPATTLWWDGFTISKNASDEDAAATFKALVYGSSTEMANANADKAVWLIGGAKPSAAGDGVLATVKAGAKPYPMTPSMGLLHTALGTELADFMQGKVDAATALANTEKAYAVAAKQKGFLK